MRLSEGLGLLYAQPKNHSGSIQESGMPMQTAMVATKRPPAPNSLKPTWGTSVQYYCRHLFEKYSRFFMEEVIMDFDKVWYFAESLTEERERERERETNKQTDRIEFVLCHPPTGILFPEGPRPEIRGTWPKLH